MAASDSDEDFYGFTGEDVLEVENRLFQYESDIDFSDQ
jgi:hypothetical protein